MAISRLQWLDAIKGIAIISVVIGHSVGCPVAIKRFVYSYHLPLFFIVAGYLFASRDFSKNEDVVRYFVKKLKRLWLPYVFIPIIVWGVIDCLILIGVFDGEIMSFSYKLKASLPRLLFFPAPPSYTGQMWFLETMFFVTIGCAVIARLRKFSCLSNILYVVPIFMLCFGFWCQLHGKSFIFLARVSSCTGIFFCGYILRKISKKTISSFLQHIILLVSFLCLITSAFWEHEISLVGNSYANPIVLLLYSISGWIFWRWFCSHDGIVQRVLSGIGESSMTILIWHMLLMAAFRRFTFSPWYAQTLIGVGGGVYHRILRI